MKLLILGICGTFMAGVARIAQQLGFEVHGYDSNIYPPMSSQLEELGIKVYEHVNDLPNLNSFNEIVIGNALSRGNEVVEQVLNNKIPFYSGPQWLFNKVLSKKRVVAISGTHGKTSTTSMVVAIAKASGFDPGFLIGGLPVDEKYSSQLGLGDWFIIEADEYDSVFYEKRPKFLHYFPEVLLINNIEFDHGDIFADLEVIKKQFHLLNRTVKSQGVIIYPDHDHNIKSVLELGSWSKKQPFRSITQKQDNLIHQFYAELSSKDGSSFLIKRKNKIIGEVAWDLIGSHNVNNALAAITIAYHMGIKPEKAIEILSQFKGIKRRLEVFHKWKDTVFYDDFAHHPTAIESTLSGLRHKIGNKKLSVVLGASSYTLHSGIFGDRLWNSLAKADQVYVLNKKLEKLNKTLDKGLNIQFYQLAKDLVEDIFNNIKKDERIIVMSSRGVTDIHEEIFRKFR